MFSNQAHRSARSSVPSFLLGAGCAAMLVLSFAGATLALSKGGFESRKQGLNELRLNRVPQAKLALDGVAWAHWAAPDRPVRRESLFAAL